MSQSAALHAFADRFWPLPGYSAMISPFLGFCSSAPTSAHEGSDVTVAPEVLLIDCEFRFSLTALYSCCSIERLLVVTILSPPVSSSCCETPPLELMSSSSTCCMM